MVRAWITKKASSFGTFPYEFNCMEETIQAYNMAGIERLLLIIISIFISNRTVNCLAQSLLSVRQSQHHQKSVATHKAPSWELFRKKITKCQSIKQGRDIFFLFFPPLLGPESSDSYILFPAPINICLKNYPIKVKNPDITNNLIPPKIPRLFVIVIFPSSQKEMRKFQAD